MLTIEGEGGRCVGRNRAGELSRVSRALVAAFVALALASRASRAAEDLTRRPGEAAEAFGTRLLPPGAALSAKPVDVNLGPAGKAVVVLFRPKQNSFNYTGWVLLPPVSGTQPYNKLVLPPLSVADGRFSVEVRSIFAADVDADRAPDLCVLARFHEFGTRDAYLSTDCFRWTRDHFDLLDEAGEKTVGLKNAKAVRAYFVKHPLRAASLERHPQDATGSSHPDGSTGRTP